MTLFAQLAIVAQRKGQITKYPYMYNFYDFNKGMFMLSLTYNR